MNEGCNPVFASFHLNNKYANKQLDGDTLSHNKSLKYLGVIFDRTLNYKLHLVKNAAKT